MNKNIVLIGMPGSGKTTLARLLSKELNIKYIDLDEEIEKYTKMSIPSLFEIGEKHFRNKETEVAKIVSEQTPLVIATGGGIVLREENMKALKEKGTIIFLNRSLDKIAEDVKVGTRPLLKEGIEKLQILYDERIHLYKRYSDMVIENNSHTSEAVQQILSKLNESMKGEDS